jgi:RNA polymerase sigma-70 factor (ECF subfamily)
MGRGVPSQSQVLARRPGVETTVTFSTLYKDEFSYVWRTLRRLGVPDRDLPDVTHDFFVVVFRQLQAYDRSRPLRPWLFGIAFRVVSDHRRTARYAREVLQDPPEIPDHAPGADDHVAAARARRQVQKVLDALDLERRAVFVMHDLDETPVPEIATALGIPLATAYSRLRLAREDVAAAIRRLRAQEERLRP